MCVCVGVGVGLMDEWMDGWMDIYEFVFFIFLPDSVSRPFLSRMNICVCVCVCVCVLGPEVRRWKRVAGCS